MDLSQDRGPAEDAIWCSLCVISMMVVALRFFCRNRFHIVGLDDWLMLAALIMFTTTTGLTIWLASIGGFKHLEAIPPSRVSYVLRAFWLIEPFGIMTLCFPKASIGWMILRIIGTAQTRWQRIFIWFLVIFVFFYNALNAILQFVECNPPKALWTPGLMESKCWNPIVETNIAISDGGEAVNAFADFCLALIPVTFLIKLHASKKRRLGLIIILGLGLLTGSCSIVKTTYLAVLSKRADLTWNSYNIYAWQAAEIFLLITLGSAPTIKPLFDSWLEKSNTSEAAYELSSHLKGIDKQFPYNVIHVEKASSSAEQNNEPKEMV